jgi:hypothetical protein
MIFSLYCDGSAYACISSSAAISDSLSKYEKFALQIKSIWKLNNVSIQPLVISAKGVVIKNFLNI